QADADLLVLPELFASGYQFLSREEAQRLAEPVPDGPTVRRLVDIAKSRKLHLVAGLPERSGSVCYNSAVVVGPSGFLGCYRKTHLFYEETQFFTPGDSGFLVRCRQDRCHDLFRLVLSGGCSDIGDSGRRDHLPSLQSCLAELPGFDARSVP
ncbi:MAG: hypothetical protein HP495_10495, partial [Nitrospira sp.]|nr:hypothetical protein [Nitrospira sp.]